MKKRLFLAIPLSASLLEKFAGLKDRYALDPGIRWTARQNLHVTLYFCGDVDEAKIREMGQKIKAVISATPAFKLAYEKLTFAPPNRPPRMVWADFAHSEEYGKLSRAIYDAVKPFLDPGSARDPGRDPHPHITLARFNNPAAARTLKLEPVPPEEMVAQSCELVASQLSPKGPIYTVMETYAFA